MTIRCIVMGAAGRDFHDVMTFFRSHDHFRVMAITAHQIPFIDQRAFPRELAGPAYDADIPIHLERELPRLIRELEVELVFLSYSDLAHEDVMHRASIVQAAGASFVLLGPRQIQLRSSLPVVAVTAARTGAGKSPLSQGIARHLKSRGTRVGILRHPMPYGDLRAQAVQRFASPEDLDRHHCTIEEREEYAPYVDAGQVVFAGVDYATILAHAELESDVILWDGGNNDVPFVAPSLWIVVVDALRPGHEAGYYPGETNLRSADVVVINKISGAAPEGLATVRANVAALRPTARVIESDLEVTADEAAALAGRRVIVIEDGPTLTHGGMPSGAGLVAARNVGAHPIDPRPFAVGTIAQAYRDFPHLGPVLPALGYSDAQIRELSETIAAARPDAILDASPAHATTWIAHDAPAHRARYRFVQRGGPDLLALVDAALSR
ncbi:MAG: hypothetical protein IT378_04995 [Sandaracinaceae bacterium]|nr:hypothetical protein [Sandaracinaceae bacterium]